VQDPDSVDSDAAAAQKLKSQPLAQMPIRKSLPEGTAYASVLDRYLGRLTATGQLPRALTVLRTQLDRNPNDPLLYERLANFLQQNNLSAQEEQIYQQALAKFQDSSYYDKLARLYLRERKREAFSELTTRVTGIFSGTDLDHFFANVNTGEPIGPQLALQLNLYAAKRFPHDLVFTHNLLNAYQATATRDTAAYEALLRRQWWESDDLRDEFLTYLSRTGKLQSELAQLESLNSQASGLRVPAGLEPGRPPRTG
jgi:tetratricopeptide (TPR) repeat protein